MEILELTEQNFEDEVMSSEQPVLVDFWAEWCGPCKMLSPIMDELAGEMEGVKIAKINIDDYPAIAQRFSVMSIPTVLFFKDAKVMDQMVGVQSKQDLRSKLESLK